MLVLGSRSQVLGFSKELSLSLDLLCARCLRLQVMDLQDKLWEEQHNSDRLSQDLLDIKKRSAATDEEKVSYFVVMLSPTHASGALRRSPKTSIATGHGC